MKKMTKKEFLDHFRKHLKYAKKHEFLLPTMIEKMAIARFQLPECIDLEAWIV